MRDVYVAAGKIVATGNAPANFGANRVIDATGRVVCPGLVDLAVRLREPGFEYLATLESEMSAAVAGGVTSFACPPDTDPPLDEPGLVEMLKHRARNLNQCRVFPQGAQIIPNPYNKIPGFSVGDVHFVPGFPVMAWPMIEWVLDTHCRAQHRAVTLRERWISR